MNCRRPDNIRAAPISFWLAGTIKWERVARVSRITSVVMVTIPLANPTTLLIDRVRLHSTLVHAYDPSYQGKLIAQVVGWTKKSVPRPPHLPRCRSRPSIFAASEASSSIIIYFWIIPGIPYSVHSRQKLAGARLASCSCQIVPMCWQRKINRLPLDYHPPEMTHHLAPPLFTNYYRYCTKIRSIRGI